ncbi:hypothetical protein C1646_788115 [Rhizophagus diaphanus]|nr:hypothetical protein C1646_788115 [Rhizophagus diaphanus] [Rhizophagus sp. MUCL 43196]
MPVVSGGSLGLLCDIFSSGLFGHVGFIFDGMRKSYMFFEFYSFVLDDFLDGDEIWRHQPQEPRRGMAPNTGIPEFYISKEAEVKIFWGSFANIFIEDVPQFIIRKLKISKHKKIQTHSVQFSRIKMNSRQIFFALLIVLMATIVTASPLNLNQLIERKNAQKDESPSKEKNGEVKATFAKSGTDHSQERD